MFDQLTNRFKEIFSSLRGKTLLANEDIEKISADIREALISADTAVEVADKISLATKAKLLDENLEKISKPSTFLSQIIQQQLTDILEQKEAVLNIKTSPATMMMIGLQGSGKTTSIAKIANLLKNSQNKKILLISLDVYRPAAIEQLQILAENAKVDFFKTQKKDPLGIAKSALKLKNKYDLLIFDTAGRMQVNQAMMTELQDIENIIKPDETLLIVDALMGQEALNISKAFFNSVDINGLVITKIEADTKGGAILSVKSVINRPIKFVGNGEKIEDITTFDHTTIVNTLMDLGDLKTLGAQINKIVDKKEAKSMSKRLKSGLFNMNDLLTNLKYMKKMGGIGKIASMIPNAQSLKKKLTEKNLNEKTFLHQEAIILAMTEAEKLNPKIIHNKRKHRIAKGSGVSPRDVDKLLKQYKNMKSTLKNISKYKKLPNILN